MKEAKSLFNIGTNQLIKIVIGGVVGAIGSVIMELANQQTMQETIKEEVAKQLEAAENTEES